MKNPAVSISVTEAARNFSDCINRARYQGTTFILHKNGVAVARIVPEPVKTDEGLKKDGNEKPVSGASHRANQKQNRRGNTTAAKPHHRSKSV